MSYAVFFSFSTGLKDAIRVPVGTLASIQQHVRNVTLTLGLCVEKYKDNAPHWVRRLAPGSKDRWLDATEPSTSISDQDYCEIAQVHNRWLRRLYADLGKWQKEPVQDGEEITPEDAQTFWHGLVDIDVPPARWTGTYYRNRMEHLYEVMRGHEDEGVSFDEDALTPKQAAAVIRLFSEFLDPADLRLDVPKDCDYLASSSDGGYDWCITNGAVLWEDGLCCDDPGCDLHQEWVEDHNEDEEDSAEDPVAAELGESA